MPKVQFIFAIHNHQPVGNFDFVAEEAYQKSYLPFLKVLDRHPSIKITLHYTGILYRFFEQKHPEFIDMLKRFVAGGRAEILSGGFYEPILAVLPDEDKIGQIRKLSAFIDTTLGYQARGMWLAERVWEPHLPKFIAEAGIDHVVVDDFHFKMAGLHDDELDGYYLTEEQNGIVRVFPGSERLRYLIPFHPPEETLEYLATLRSPSRYRLSVMADDGEKFGVWPETYRTVYEEGWLDRFFTLIEQNSEWLETTTFSEFADQEPPRGRVYLPTASYMEMGEWTLPTRAMKEYDDALETVKGKPEFSGLRPFIQGRHLAELLHQVFRKQPHAQADAHGKPEGRCGIGRARGAGREKRRRGCPHAGPCVPGAVQRRLLARRVRRPLPAASAHRHLRAADPGGVSGGQCAEPAGSRVQGPGVRENRKKSRRHLPGSRSKKGDFDRDGRDEVMMNSELLNLFIDPAEGGRITEIDWKPRSFNLTNTLTRRREVLSQQAS